MKLRKAVKILKDLAAAYPDHEVYLARDEEGNGFTTLAGPDGMYFTGKVDGKPVIVLWPGGHSIEEVDE